MNYARKSLFTALTIVCLFSWLNITATHGQETKPKFPPLRGLQGLSSSNSAPGSLKIQAQLFNDTDSELGRLDVIVDVAEGWHIFSLTQPKGGPPKTEIVLQPATGLELIGPFKANKKPIRVEPDVFPVHQEYYEGQVIWSAPVKFSADPQSVSVAGEIKGQICSESSCLPLGTLDTKFISAYGGTAEIEDTAGAESAVPPILTTSGAASGAAFDWGLLMKNIGLGLLGGAILNLMPCVLPVIGLKLMSFIEQAQGNRWEALRLNVIYAAGILTVFLALATASIFLNLGWGEQFTNTTFKMTMVILVFAMALSFLGVWEIPIPGFVGRGKSEELAAREGASGAFFKGVFTTILATPCSGPFLGPIFGYTIKQPAFVTYAIMISIGLGLALPYLIIGAFPGLIRWIPKPGAWMDTFKQLMGFVLLGATVFLISALNDELFLATLATIFGVWFGCWYIGRTPITASLDRKLASWIGGIAIACAIGFASFNYLIHKERHIQWQPYSPAALAAATQQGKTVLVDFTADWCLACKLNLKTAIDTQRVGDLIREQDVVALLADYTDQSEEIKNALAELDSQSIPLLAIYPAGAPNDPIVLRDLLSESTVVTALRDAGPSVTVVAGEQRLTEATRETGPVPSL